MISIVMPVYNRANIINKTIDSVLCQSYKDFELIIIDDCSTDNLKDVIEKYHDKRIVYVKNDSNRGSNYSRNRGINLTRGEIISFIDSSDIWYSDKLEKEYIEINNNADAVFCAEYQIINNEKKIIPGADDSDLIKKGELKEILARHNVVDTTTLIIKKSVLEEIGRFDENISRLQDYELMLRVIEKRYNVSYIEEPLVEASILSDSISKDLTKLIESVPKIYFKHKKFFKEKNTAIDFLKTPLNYFDLKPDTINILISYLRLLIDLSGSELDENIEELQSQILVDLLRENYLKEYSYKRFTKFKTIIDLIRSEKHVYIFGTGLWSELLLEVLKNEGLEKKICAFVLSDKGDNPSYRDYKLVGINDCERENLIVVAASYKRTYEIVRTLDNLEYKKIAILDNDDRKKIMEFKGDNSQ